MVKVYRNFECADNKLRKYVSHLENRIYFLEERNRSNMHTIDMLLRMYIELKNTLDNVPDTPPILSDLELDDDFN